MVRCDPRSPQRRAGDGELLGDDAPGKSLPSDSAGRRRRLRVRGGGATPRRARALVALAASSAACSAAARLRPPNGAAPPRRAATGMRPLSNAPAEETCDTFGFSLSAEQAASYIQWAQVSAAAGASSNNGRSTSGGFPPPSPTRASPPPTAPRPSQPHDVWSIRQQFPRYKQVKRLVRAGIPQAMRYRLWMQISGAMARWEAQPTHYDELLARARADGGLARTTRNESEKDLHRTFPNHPAFDKEGVGRAKLQNVLTAYALRNDTVGYCQSLNYVGAMLLVALQFEEEAAFWMLAALVEQVLPDFYSRAMTGILIEQAVFASFVREMAPDVHSHFEELGVPLEMVSTQWFLCLYVNVLPVATLLRVWDAMLWEGPAVLLRCGAALLYCYREAVQSTSDFAEISQLLQRLGHDMWHADRLLAHVQQGGAPLPSQAQATADGGAQGGVAGARGGAGKEGGRGGARPRAEHPLRRRGRGVPRPRHARARARGGRCVRARAARGDLVCAMGRALPARARARRGACCRARSST